MIIFEFVFSWRRCMYSYVCISWFQNLPYLSLPYLCTHGLIQPQACLFIHSCIQFNYLAPSNSSTRLSISSTPRNLASISSLSPSSRNLLSASKGPKKYPPFPSNWRIAPW